MIRMNGKYNHTEIFADEIDDSTRDQIQTFLDCPAFQKSHIAIMPDCHAGEGACIGFTMILNGWIIPNIVGVDIGCGVDAYELGPMDIDYASLDRFIRENIPSGFNIRSEIPHIVNSQVFISLVLNTCDRTNQDFDRVMRSIGTLGGGNHFIEIDEDPFGNKWLLVHTGSRNFGLKIATYYQDLAREFSKKVFQEKMYPKLEYLIDYDANSYLCHMGIAQDFATTNRYVICREVAGYLGHDITGLYRGGKHYISSVHNYIDMEDKIIRKGAISAKGNEPVVIPFNMRDGCLIGQGKGNTRYNCSAPHGSGRVLSRKVAKEILDINEFTNEMSGIWSSCVQESTLDESPMAYKDKNTVLKYIEETVTPFMYMKPTYNFKNTTAQTRKGK